MRESQDLGRDTDRLCGVPELPQLPSQSAEHEPNVAPVPEQHDVWMLDPESPETPGDQRKRPMRIMTNRPPASLSRTVAVHIGNGDLSTKCFLRNLRILWRREDGLLQRDLRLLVKMKNSDRNE